MEALTARDHIWACGVGCVPCSSVWRLWLCGPFLRIRPFEHLTVR